MSLENVLSHPMVERIGWTLIHFLWQGVVLAAMLAVELVLFRRSRAGVRYIAACVTLALMAVVPCVTMLMVPVSEAAYELAADISMAPSNLNTGVAEAVSVSTPVETEPSRAKDVVPPVLNVSTSYSWRQRAEVILEPILPYLVLGWLMGVFGLSVWHLGGWTQLQRLRRKMVKPVDASLHSKLKRLAELLGVRRAVALMESALVQVPTVVGWLKPVILLPASALTGLSPEQMEAILAHELAHIKRLDYLVNMLQTVVEILGFYHPAVWWVSHKIRVERENCCDDLAVSVSGDRVRYARALTLLEEIRGGQAALAVAASGGSLLGRIRRLLCKASQEDSRSGWVPAVIAILLIFAAAVPTTIALSTGADKKTGVELETGWGEAEAEAVSSPRPRFAATLSNGVTVELLGLYHGETIEDLVFWKPDGSPFSDSETQKYRERVEVYPKGGNKFWKFEYGLMARFSPLDELSAEVFVKQGQRMSYQYPRSDGIAIALVASDGQEREKGFSKVGHIKAAAAYGEWETRVWSAGISEASVLYLDEHSNIMLSPPRRTGERADGGGYGGGYGRYRRRSPRRKTDEWLVDVTVNAGNIDFDCFYKLKDGSIHQAKWRETLGHPKWIGPDQRTPMICKRYALSHEPEDREYIIVKYRRFEIVEFRNVSLKPGVKTEVEVAVGHSAPEIPSEPARQERRLSREEIRAKLQNLEIQRNRVQKELDAAEMGLTDVRRRWGFADLEERSYPHPVTARLMRLEKERDNSLVEIAQLKAKIETLDKQGDSAEKEKDLKKAREDLAVLTGKLEELQKMCEEAAAKKRDLDLARVQYKQRASVRDERKRMLDSLKAEIEKLKILHDDPQTPEKKIDAGIN